jgi:AcrR family transcriptional regulator
LWLTSGTREANLKKDERTHYYVMKSTRTRQAPSPPRRGKRAENKDKTRRAILRAALELFAQKGFYSTTTKAISRQAEIAEGTLFNYFETKEDLALYFFEQELAGMIEWYQQNKRIRRASLPEKLFAIIHHFLERLAPYEDFIGAVYLRALQPASKLSPLSLQSQEQNIRYLRFIRDILTEAAREEEIPEVGDFGAYAFAVFHLAAITYWLQDRSPGKEQTLALLDRCLKLATMLVQRGGWEW